MRHSVKKFLVDITLSCFCISYNKATDNSSISNTETCPKNTLVLLSHMPGLVQILDQHKRTSSQSRYDIFMLYMIMKLFSLQCRVFVKPEVHFFMFTFAIQDLWQMHLSFGIHRCTNRPCIHQQTYSSQDVEDTHPCSTQTQR